MARILSPTCFLYLLLHLWKALADSNPNISFCFSRDFPSDCVFQNLKASKFEFGRTQENVLNITESNESFVQLKCEASYPIRWLGLQPVGRVRHIPQKGNEDMDQENFKYTHQIYADLNPPVFSQVFRCVSYSNTNLFSELFLNAWGIKVENKSELTFEAKNSNGFIVEEFTENSSTGLKSYIVPCIAKRFGQNPSVKLTRYSSKVKSKLSDPTRNCVNCICRAASECPADHFPCSSPKVCGTLPSLIWNGWNSTEIPVHNDSDCSSLTGREGAPLMRRDGARVARGADWIWGDEDGDPPGEGRVVSFVGDEMIRVQWASGVNNRYRVGRDGKYDLRPLDCSTMQDNLRCISTSACATEKLLAYFWFRHMDKVISIVYPFSRLQTRSRSTVRDCDGDGIISCIDYALINPSYPWNCTQHVTSHLDKLTACLTETGENDFTIEAVGQNDYDPRIGIKIQEVPNGNYKYECSAGPYSSHYLYPLSKQWQNNATLSLVPDTSSEPIEDDVQMLIQCSPKQSVPTLNLFVGKCNSVVECDLKFGSIRPRIQLHERENFWRRDDEDFHKLRNSLSAVSKYKNGFIICSTTYHPDNQTNLTKFVYVEDHMFTGLDNKMYLVSEGFPSNATIRLEASEQTEMLAKNTQVFICKIFEFLLFPQVYFEVEYKTKGRSAKKIGIGQCNEGFRIYAWDGDESKLMKSWKLELVLEEDMAALTCNSRWINSKGLISDEIRLNVTSADANANSVNVLWAVGALCAGVIILALTTLILILFRKYRRSMVLIRNLTTAEIDEFLKGCKSQQVKLDGNGDLIADALAFPQDMMIQSSRLITEEKLLGKGEYGMVCKGQLDGVDVAIKTTKPIADVEYFKAFLREIKVMSYIGENQNIVKFYGAVVDRIKERVCFAVLELSPFGNLNEFLKNYFANTMELRKKTEDERFAEIPQKINQSILTSFCKQIATGMEFMAQKKVIHGDLATRNVLVFPNNVVKVTDFGLSRKLYDCAEYVKTKQAPLPWRWMAIESLRHFQFSTQSDVWSFGVTLWEIFSFSQVPFSGLTWTPDFVSLLESGERLSKPSQALDSVYEWMLRCWESDPEKRPPFADSKIFFINLESIVQQNDRIYGTFMQLLLPSEREEGE